MAPPGYYQKVWLGLGWPCYHSIPCGVPLLLWITVGILAVFWVIAIWYHLTGGFVTFALGVCLFLTIVMRLWLPRRRRQAARPPG